MSVNTSEISSVYTELMTTITTKYDAMWAANKIDPETYSKLVGEASSQLIQLSADLVQKQENLDKDLEIKERQMLEAETVGLHKRETLDAQDIKESQSRIDTSILSAQLSAWSSAFNGGKIDNIPELISDKEIKNTYEWVSSDIPTAQ